MDNKNGWMTIAQAAEYIQVSTNKMYQLVWDGEVPSKRFGTSIRIRQSDLDKMPDEKKNK